MLPLLPRRASTFKTGVLIDFVDAYNNDETNENADGGAFGSTIRDDLLFDLWKVHVNFASIQRRLSATSWRLWTTWNPRARTPRISRHHPRVLAL